MPVGRCCPEYEEDRADPGASFMAQILWDAVLAGPNSEMGPENGLSGVLAIRSGILSSIHRKLNLKHPNATNPGKPGFVSNLTGGTNLRFFYGFGEKLNLRFRPLLLLRCPADDQPALQMPWGHCRRHGSHTSGYEDSHPDARCNGDQAH